MPEQTHQLSELDRAELTRLEEGMWQAASRFDEQFQDTRFAQDFFEFGRSGRVYVREQAIRAAASPLPAQLPLANLKIRALDRDTAQVTYDSVVHYDSGVEYAHRSSIWTRAEVGWVMRFHRGTAYDPCDPASRNDRDIA